MPPVLEAVYLQCILSAEAKFGLLLPSQFDNFSGPHRDKRTQMMLK